MLHSLRHSEGFRVHTETVSTKADEQQSTEVFCLAEGYVTLFTALIVHLEGFHFNSALPSHKTADISQTALHNFLWESWSDKVILNCRMHEITVCAVRRILFTNFVAKISLLLLDCNLFALPISDTEWCPPFGPSVPELYMRPSDYGLRCGMTKLWPIK